VSGAEGVEPTTEHSPAGVPSRHGAWPVSARAAGLAVSSSVKEAQARGGARLGDRAAQ
jgi:hypothetical protein